MKRFREDHEESRDNLERWLLTYSDMITLLLALFIILYGMSTIDHRKVEAMSHGLQKALHNEVEKKIQEGEKMTIDQPAAGAKAPEHGGIMVELSNGFIEAYTALDAYIREKELQDKLDVMRDKNKVIITLKSDTTFGPNSAALVEGCEENVKNIAAVLAKVYDKVGKITVSGHTADTKNPAEENAAWILSANRALTVLEVLTDGGTPAEKLSIEGYSHYRPAATNDTPEGRAINRRVEITIT
ncbi:MAG: flagellar motor protein MotB [Oscillospiraceae bacterium]|jgi:chemotaxis protein MotB|nr:flagellar motor protein MotB [Oscillospiraceae bacterium]